MSQSAGARSVVLLACVIVGVLERPTLDAQGSLPGAPQNLHASVSGYTLSVAWEAPITIARVTGYVLDFGLAPGDFNLGNISVGLLTSIAFPVPPGVYYFRVHAENSLGVGPPSAEIAVTVGAGGGTAIPSAPQSLTAIAAGNALAVSWIAPAIGAPITQYILQAGTAPGFYNLNNGPVGVLTNVAAPVPNGVYYFRVWAENAYGAGPPTAEVSVTVGSGTAVPSVPQNFTATATGNALSVTWDPPAIGAPLTRYILQAGGAPGFYNLNDGPVGLVTSVAAPVPNGVYYFRLWAENAFGAGPPTAEVSVTVGSGTALPSVPQSLTATSTGNGLAVTWAAPAIGAPLTRYILQAGTAPGLYNLNNGPVGLVTSVAAPAPNGVYYFRVWAENAYGAGPPTAEVSVTVGSGTALPSVPQNFTAIATGNGLAVTWAAPAIGAPITQYILQAGTAPGTYNLNNGSVGLLTSVGAPVPNGVYYFRVWAENAYGPGPPTVEVSVVVVGGQVLAIHGK